MRTRIAAGCITIVCAVVAALVVVYLIDRGGTSATAYTVAQRAVSHESAIASALGPNTTVHEVVILHVSTQQAALNGTPQDTRSEGWWAFDASGDLSAYFGRTTDLTGKQTFENQILRGGGALVITDLATGETQGLKHYSLSVADLESRLGIAIAANKAALTSPDAPATLAADGSGAYIVATDYAREYVDPQTYRVVKIEELAPDGSVRETREYPVLDVVPGNAVPTPGTTATAPAEASPTATATVAPAATPGAAAP